MIFDEKNEMFKDFLKDNPGYGYLKVRASMASEAVPVSDVNVVISLNYKDENIIFFEGKTNESGVIEKIKLPTPFLDDNNLIRPNKIVYTLDVRYNDFRNTYSVAMYEGVCVVQNINIPVEDINGY